MLALRGKYGPRWASIGYEEIVGGHHTPAELRRVVEKVMRIPK